MLKKYKNIRHYFTLAELLVAMVVFSIMLLLMMQFFSGAQRIWVSTEQKNNLYADARVAMDLMSTFLQGAYYTHGDPDSTNYSDQCVPFIFVRKTLSDDYAVDKKTYNDAIYFPTQTQMDLIEDTGKIMFVTFQRGRESYNQENELRMAVLTDASDDMGDKFSMLFPPYDDTSEAPFKNRSQVAVYIITHLYEKITEKNSNAEKHRLSSQSIVLLDNVTSFRINPILKSNLAKGTDCAETANSMDMPYLIEIQLTLMDKKAYALWKEMKDAGNTNKAQEFRLQNEHTFTRAVYLGDRMKFPSTSN